MPDELDDIIRNMINEGEPEENIAAVIKSYKPKPKAGSGLNKPIKSASTWGQGVMDSLTGGEAAMTGLRGLGGFAKGAVLDLPSSMWEGAKSLVKSQSPNMMDRAELYRDMASMPGQMLETTKQAGSNPEAFGEMVGQITGQPLVTEGLSRIPVSSLARGTRAIGDSIKAVGDFQKTKAPLSKLMPRAASIPAVEAVERAAGSGVSKIGDRMRKVGLPKVLQNSEYGPVPFTPEQPLRSPTGSNKGSMAYPEMNPYDPSVTLNNEYGPINFEPPVEPISPTGDLRGSNYAPDTSTTAPEMIPNSGYGPEEFTPDQPLINPTGRDKGMMAYPELNDTPPSLMQNNQYGPTDEFVNSVLAPTGRNKGSMMYPEMNDTPPSLVPNSQAAIDEFMQSVMAPTGEARGSMYSPEISERPPDLIQNHEYGPIDFTPPEPQLPAAREWKPPSREPSIELLEDSELTNNASGESGASVEAMNRVKQMAKQGKKFVVYDKSGKFKELVGPDAVDYVAKKGETYGIQGPDGFQPLDNKGGKIPKKNTGGTLNKEPIPVF